MQLLMDLVLLFGLKLMEQFFKKTIKLILLLENMEEADHHLNDFKELHKILNKHKLKILPRKLLKFYKIKIFNSIRFYYVDNQILKHLLMN